MPNIEEKGTKDLYKDPIEEKKISDIIEQQVEWGSVAKAEGTPEDNANKREIFSQTAAPTKDYKEGDLWFDTDDDNHLYRANSNLDWVSQRDGGVGGIATFAQASVPTALNAGDIWYDTDDGNKMYRATNAGDDQVVAGEWEAVTDSDLFSKSGDTAEDIAEGATNKFAAESGADVTANNTANDTSNLNGQDAGLSKNRLNYNFKEFFYTGNYNDGFTEVADPILTRTLLFSYLYSTGTRTYLQGPDIGSTNGLVDFDNDMELNCAVKCYDTNDNKFWGILENGESAPNLGDINKRAFGFLVDGGGKLYAICCDASDLGGGTNYDSEEITGYTLTDNHHYKIEYEAGVSIKFYVDDTLEATLTNYIPSGANDPRIYFEVDKDSSNSGMYINNNYSLKVTI